MTKDRRHSPNREVDGLPIAAAPETLGLRFAFGRNWRSYLRSLNEERIEAATTSLCSLLGCRSLTERRFLDIGSGSGLLSLAAYRLGAAVVSFDADPDSLACTEFLRQRYATGDDRWQVLRGSVLDEAFLRSLGTFEIVYSWGVLHHTGALWKALELTAARVAAGGQLAIALYNDQGWRSRLWWHIKRIYCLGTLGRVAVSAVFYPLFSMYALARDLSRLRLPGDYARHYFRTRGMTLFHDWRDWLGGFPYEVAQPAAVVAHLKDRGFVLQRQSLTQGWGCNEFVFQRVPV